MSPILVCLQWARSPVRAASLAGSQLAPEGIDLGVLARAWAVWRERACAAPGCSLPTRRAGPSDSADASGIAVAGIVARLGAIDCSTWVTGREVIFLGGTQLSQNDPLHAASQRSWRRAWASWRLLIWRELIIQRRSRALAVFKLMLYLGM